MYFPLSDGRHQKIDLTFFDAGPFPRPRIAKTCAEVFWLCLHGYSSAIRARYRNELKRFNNFLDWRAERDASCHMDDTTLIDASLFIEFQAHLSATNKENKESTCAHSYHSVTRFFELMRKTRREHLSPSFSIPANPFSFKSWQHGIRDDILRPEHLKLIVDAATKEVKQIRENHNRALELLKTAAPNDEQARKNPKPEGFWRSIANALYYIVNVVGITTRTPNIAQALGKNNHPRLPELIGWYAPTADEYFVPFLVLLYVRTAINVTSIYKLKRDCLTEHPLPLGLTICRFTKPRSGAQSEKELSFPTNGSDGVVDLIRFLLAYTEPWVEYANDAEKEALFLYRCRIEGVRSAGDQFTGNSISRFIARHNLPHFAFNQLRPTIATLIYLQTRDIFRVQRLLKHASIRTTLKYIRGAMVHAEHSKTMGEGIDAMVEAVTGISLREKGGSVFAESMTDVIAAKVKEDELTPEAADRILKGGCNTFMGRCKDPMNSPQPGEIKGRVCRSLHACFFARTVGYSPRTLSR